MALSTQVMLLNLVILADSYLFAFDLFDGHDHHRLPLGLPPPVKLPGVYLTPRPMLHKDPYRERPKYPFTSDATTPRREPIYKVTTIAPPTTTEEIKEDISGEKPDIEREVFLMKNVKVPDSMKPEEETKVPVENSLPLDKDREISENTFRIPDSEMGSVFVTTEPNVGSRNENTNDSGSSSDNDLFVVPVNAVNPETILNPISNRAPAKDISITFANNGGNTNTVPYSPPVTYTNNNNVMANSASNLYTLVPISNPMPNNNYYLQPSGNNPQIYNIVPMNNMPVGTNQPNNIVPFVNNPPNSFVTLNNNQPNNFVSSNIQPSNVVPFNSAPNSFIPLNNNQPGNFVPFNNQPGNIITYNNIPNNFIPLNNQPNNYVQPNNILVPVNNNNAVTSNNQPLVLINGVFYSTQPMSNQPNNYVSYNNVPNNNIPNNVIALNPNSNLPNPNNNLPTNVVSFLSNNNAPNNVLPSNPNNSMRPVVALPANNNLPTNFGTLTASNSNSNPSNKVEFSAPNVSAPNNIAPAFNQPQLGSNLGDTKDLEEEDEEPALESGKEMSDK